MPPKHRIVFDSPGTFGVPGAVVVAPSTPSPIFFGVEPRSASRRVAQETPQLPIPSALPMLPMPGESSGGDLSRAVEVESLQLDGTDVTGKGDLTDYIPTYNPSEVIPDPLVIQSLIASDGMVDAKSRDVLKYKMWRLTPLYRTSATGALLMWWIGFNIETHELTMVFGHVGGKIRAETTKVELNLSGRDIHTQSVQEARQRYQIKYRNEHYRPPGEKPKFFNKPMLAKKLEKGKTRLRFPVLVQPKLDGARCLARLEDGEMIFRSRGDVRWLHLNDEFGEEVAKFLSYIPYQCELDGEAYLHGKKFTEFAKILKNMRVKDPQIKDLHYYIYDFNSAEPIVMEDRIAILNQALAAYEADGNIRTRFSVLQTYTVSSMEDIERAHRHFRTLGFEGTIIRKMAGPGATERQIKEALYKSGRGLNLIKYKDIEDAEGTVVGIEDARGTEAGAAILIIRCTHPNASGTMITTDVPMRPAYSIEERRIWLANPSSVMGKKVTYEYAEISEYGVPRNPVMKAFRDYEGDIDSD